MLRIRVFLKIAHLRTEDVEVVEVVVQLVEQLTPAVQCGAVPVRPVT